MIGFRKNKGPMGRGALLLIALLFGLSALIRIGAGPGRAIAQEIAALRESPDETVPAEPPACPQPPEVRKLLSELSKRQTYLDTRTRELEEFEKALEFARIEIEKRLDELQAAESELSDLLALSETAAEKDLQRLTAVYENMKPAEAAKVFEQMAPEFAAGFMGRMRADAAAAIMAGLPPEMGYSISVILAGRNAQAPQQ